MWCTGLGEALVFKNVVLLISMKTQWVKVSGTEPDILDSICWTYAAEGKNSLREVVLRPPWWACMHACAWTLTHRENKYK